MDSYLRLHSSSSGSLISQSGCALDPWTGGRARITGKTRLKGEEALPAPFPLITEPLVGSYLAPDLRAVDPADVY